MNPYRTPPSDERELGPRWGVTSWTKFWVKHKTLENFVFLFLILFIVIPIRIVMCPFTNEHPLDF